MSLTLGTYHRTATSVTTIAASATMACCQVLQCRPWHEGPFALLHTVQTLREPGVDIERHGIAGGRLVHGTAKNVGMVDIRAHVYRAYSSGHTSTTPWATAHGVFDTMVTASSKFLASITAKPATGSEEVMKGPFLVSGLAASGFLT
jgi:hypothetical protein